MKTPILLSLLGLTFNLYAQNQSPGIAPPSPLAANSSVVEISPYAVAQRGPHNRVWEKVLAYTDGQGATIYQTNSFVELATGLNVRNGGQWVDASDQIQITPNGAAATNAQQQVSFAPNINGAGAINLTTPDGQTMTSEILGLSYYDSSTGQSVLFAELQDSIGQLLPSGNQIIYTNAFSNSVCDVLYTHRLSGFEQDIVVRQQLPAPASFGLNGNSLWLQVWTEFIAPPSPQITPMENGDSFLDFGVMKMGPGKAFMLGAPSNAVSVVKDWVVTQGRTFLVESVPLNAISAKLAELPSAGSSSGPSNSGPGNGAQSNSRLTSSTVAFLTPPHVNIATLKLPARRLTKKSSGVIRLARSYPNVQGLVLDYNAVNGSQTSFTFQGDTTYYISGAVDLFGTNVIEGDAVIKFTNSTAATITATNIIWRTAPYRPAIFTAKDDDSVGDSIPGSAGSPGTNLYANVALDLSAMSSCTVSNARFSCLTTAIGATNVILNNVQISQCGSVLTEGPGIYHLKNVLASTIMKFFPGTSADGGSSITGENVTVHNCSSFFGDLTSTMSLTNCLLIAVTNWQCATVTTNCTAVVSNDTGIFQTVGAGAHYLADDTYRDLGTTNIDPNLLSQLQQMTTYPPLEFTNIVVFANTTLAPQASRDVGTALDLGYHYVPLDFLVDTYVFTNASLTVTNGVAMANFNDFAGIWLQDGSSIVSIGTPTNPNWFTRYSSVQEMPISIGTASPASCSCINSFHYGSVGPNGIFRFAKFSCPAGGGFHLDHSGSFDFNNLLVKDCEFWSGTNNFGAGTASDVAVLDNNLFARSGFNAQTPTPTGSLYLTNNLFWNTSVAFIAPTGAQWYAFNNSFDTCFLSEGFRPMTNDYNAYILCTGSGHLNPNGAHDLVLSSALTYQNGPLGGFYQGSTNLVDEGSTNANYLTLFHYTTHTNQMKETNSIVDIGYHYVAVDNNGNPFDTDGDGVPDYLEDANGNGVVDSGETSWTNATDLGLNVIITRPANNSNIP